MRPLKAPIFKSKMETTNQTVHTDEGLEVNKTDPPSVGQASGPMDGSERQQRHRNTKDGGPPKRKGPRLSIIPSNALLDSNLTPAHFRVLALLCCSTNRHGHTIRSQNKMAKELGFARSTIQRALNRLEERGWIERVDNRRPDGGRCSLGYIVNYGDDTNSKLPERKTNKRPIIPSRKAAPAAARRHGQPTRCGNTKNAQSNNAVKKTDFVDSIENVSGRCCQGSRDKKTSTMSRVEQKLRAQETENYVENAKQALLLVGIHLEHSNISDGLETIMEWNQLGADIDFDIIPMLEKVMAKTKHPPRSLRYFTQAIKNSMKRRLRDRKQ